MSRYAVEVKYDHEWQTIGVLAAASAREAVSLAKLEARRKGQVFPFLTKWRGRRR